MPNVRQILLVAELALDADEGVREDEVVQQASLHPVNTVANLDVLHGREAGVKHVSALAALEVQVQGRQVN